MVKDEATRTVVCPYCPPKNKRSRFFAVHKLFITPKGRFKCVCKACHRSFMVTSKGEYIIKESLVEVIKDDNIEKHIIERRKA